MDRIRLSRKRRIFKRRRAARGRAISATIIAISVATGLVLGILLTAIEQSNHTDSASASQQLFIADS